MSYKYSHESITSGYQESCFYQVMLEYIPHDADKLKNAKKKYKKPRQEETLHDFYMNEAASVLFDLVDYEIDLVFIGDEKISVRGTEWKYKYKPLVPFLFLCMLFVICRCCYEDEENLSSKIADYLIMHHKNATVKFFQTLKKCEKADYANSDDHVNQIEEQDEKKLIVEVDSESRAILYEAEQMGIIKNNSECHCYAVGDKGTKAQVAYLCGRLFCNDFTDNGRWESGGRMKNSDKYKKLMGFDVAGTRRSQRGKGQGKSPKGYQLIDRIIKK